MYVLRRGALEIYDLRRILVITIICRKHYSKFTSLIMHNCGYNRKHMCVALCYRAPLKRSVQSSGYIQLSLQVGKTMVIGMSSGLYTENCTYTGGASKCFHLINLIRTSASTWSHLSSVQNPSLIPFNPDWFIWILPLDQYNPHWVLGSIFHQLQ